MKKSILVMITLLGTIGGLLLAVGMCMCLLPEWNALTPGVALSAIGGVTLLSIWPVLRGAAGKAPVHLTGGYAAAALLGLIGAVGLGIGLVGCLRAVTPRDLAVGMVGIFLLLAALLVGRRAAGKSAVPFNGRLVRSCCIGTVGTLLLGVGMCLTMVWGTAYLIPGIVLGCVGLLVCVLNLVLRLVKTV